jgi:hypothetical protein
MVARPRLVRALAFTLLLGACGTSASQRVNGVQGTKSNSSIVRTPATVGAAATSVAPAASGAQPANVSPTLQFTAAKLDGGTLQGAELAGKPVAFWFWAPG